MSFYFNNLRFANNLAFMQWSQATSIRIKNPKWITLEARRQLGLTALHRCLHRRVSKTRFAKGIHQS